MAGLTSVVAGVALVVATALALRPALANMPRRGVPAFVALALLAFAALAVTAAAGLHADRATLPRLAALGVVLATVGLALARTEQALARAGRSAGSSAGSSAGRPAGRSNVALVSALAVAITGAAVASPDPRMLLAACAAATWTALAVAFRLERAALLWPALALSAATYLLLPAPVRELALTVRTWFAGQLGYTPERLPLSFYGITFLPYTAAVAVLAHLLRKRGREAFARVALGWTLSVAGGLAMLSVTAGSDARAAIAVLGAEGALLLVLGVVMQRQRLVLAGTLGGIGSVIATLVHVAPAHGDSVLVLALLGLALVGIAYCLQRRGDAEGFARRASHALLDAAGLLALGTAAFAFLPPDERLLAVRAADAVSYLMLAALLACVASAFALAWLEPLAWLGVGVAGIAVCGGDTSGLLLPSAGELCALVSILPVLWAAFVRRRPALVRPNALSPATRSVAATIAGVALLQVLAGPAVYAQVETGLGTWSLCRTLGTAAVVLVATAVWSRVAGVTIPACALLGGSALAATSALGYPLSGMFGAASLALTALALAGTAVAARTSPRASHALAPTAPAAMVAAGVALLLMLGARLLFWFTTPPRADSMAFALATGAVLVACIGAMRTAPGVRVPGAVIATIAVPLVAIALCDALAAPAAWYPLGVIAGACAARRAAKQHGAVAAAFHLAFALALAGAFAATDLTSDWLLVVVFALFALVARTALAPLPRVRSLFVLVGGLGTLWVGLATGLAWTDHRWLPAIALGYTALATFAPRVASLGIEARGTAWFVKPIAGMALLLAAAHAVLALPAGTLPLRDPGVRGPAVDAAAAALALLGCALGVHARGIRRALFPAVAVALAAFITGPCSERLANAGASPWPDLEVALVGLAVALFAAPSTAARDPWGSPRSVLAYWLALVALGLTALELRDPTTPLTAAIIALVPLTLLWRERQPGHGEAFGWALLLASFSTVVYLVPDGERGAEVLLPLAAIAAGLALGFELVRRRLAQCTDDRRTADLLARDLARAAARLTLGGLGIGLALVTCNVLAAAGSPASATRLACGLATSGLAAWLFCARARREERAWSLHAAVVAGVIGYAFSVHRSAMLAVFTDHHLQVLAVLGVGLLSLARRARPVLARALTLDALALPLPGVIVGLATSSADAALALFVASAVYGYAALALSHRALAWVAAALLNAALFSLWRDRGLVDPAFYGVPAGLTLLAGAELARRASARAAFFVLGLVVLYGSIAVQVARVEAPTHALALFAAGLAAVCLGFARRRNDYLLAGTAAVILDVIAYLARHGLERDFIGAALLVGSGLTVLATAVAARRRRGQT